MNNVDTSPTFLPATAANIPKGLSQNTIDRFKGMDAQDVKNILKPSQFPFAVLFEQLQGDWNISGLTRTCNAFNGTEVFYCGRRKVDRRMMVGAHRYTEVNYLTSMDEVIALKSKYVFVGLEIGVAAKNMRTFDWPDNALIIAGEESTGLSKEMLALCDHIVYIEQFGSVRSMNAATAGSIAMYDYVSKYLNKPRIVESK